MRRFSRPASLALAAAIMSGCATTSEPRAVDVITAADAYSPRVGDVWTFVNGYGDTTTITSEAAPQPAACRSGNNIVWHYRKNAARAYWQPGYAGAEIQFLLHQDADGSWRATSSMIHDATSQVTWMVLDNPAPEENGYRITPPTLHRGESVVIETLADARGGPGIFTLGCVFPDQPIVSLPGHGEQWRTAFYMEDVATPIYSGAAAVSEQWENCNLARDNVECGHEKWWFAPSLGLVKVWQLNSGSGHPGDEDPKIIMVRVR